jgi:hypothetical protein
MKNIVAYKIIMAIGFLTWISTLSAQKPGIDLISSHQQNRHPEAIIDTCFTIDSMAHDPVTVKASPAQNQVLPVESAKKKRRQIGPSLDTIFQKEENANRKQSKSKKNSALNSRSTNLFRILIYITAFK